MCAIAVIPCSICGKPADVYVEDNESETYARSALCVECFKGLIETGEIHTE